MLAAGVGEGVVAVVRVERISEAVDLTIWGRPCRHYADGDEARCFSRSWEGKSPCPKGWTDYADLACGTELCLEAVLGLAR